MSDTMKVSCLFYDIPTTSRIENPSRRLRRIGIRLNLSAWALPNHLIPHALLHSLTERGVNWYTLEFSTAESEKLTKIAHDSLRRDITAAVARAEKSLAAARAAYEHPEEGSGPVSVSAFEERTDKAIKRAQQLLGDLEEAARVFRIDPATLPVAWAMGQAEVLRSAAHARARAYAGAGVEAARVGGVDGAAIAAAVRADDIPANVVSDFVEEHGGDNAALVAAFGPDERLDDWGDEETLSWE